MRQPSWRLSRVGETVEDDGEQSRPRLLVEVELVEAISAQTAASARTDAATRP